MSEPRVENDVSENVLFEKMARRGMHGNLKDFDDIFIEICLWDIDRKKKICVDSKFCMLDINGIEIL